MCSLVKAVNDGVMMLGYILGCPQDWEVILSVMATPAQTLPTSSSPEETTATPTTTAMAPDEEDRAHPDGNSQEEGVACISQEDVVKLLLSTLPPENVGELVSRRHMVLEEELHALLVETTSLHTQQRYVCVSA